MSLASQLHLRQTGLQLKTFLDDLYDWEDNFSNQFPPTNKETPIRFSNTKKSHDNDISDSLEKNIKPETKNKFKIKNISSENTCLQEQFIVDNQNLHANLMCVLTSNKLYEILTQKECLYFTSDLDSFRNFRQIEQTAIKEFKNKNFKLSCKLWKSCYEELSTVSTYSNIPWSMRNLARELYYFSLNNIGVCYYYLKQDLIAIEYFNKLLGMNINFESFLRRAIVYARKGNYINTLIDLKKASGMITPNGQDDNIICELQDCIKKNFTYSTELTSPNNKSIFTSKQDSLNKNGRILISRRLDYL